MAPGVRVLPVLLALLWVGVAGATAASPGSTDDLRLTTTRPSASTGVVASEVFNARYANGDLKPIRHSLIAFPEGTTFDPGATETCAATDADFRAKGMSACPASAKIGSGQATIVTTGIPVGLGPLRPPEVGPIGLDVTIFARTDGSIMVFSENAVYVTSQLIRADGRFQRTDTPPACIVVTEQPHCQNGEFAARSLSVTIPPRSRFVDGQRHNLITTPPDCPDSGSWQFSDEHTFADGSVDLFVNHPACIPD